MSNLASIFIEGLTSKSDNFFPSEPQENNLFFWLPIFVLRWYLLHSPFHYHLSLSLSLSHTHTHFFVANCSVCVCVLPSLKGGRGNLPFP